MKKIKITDWKLAIGYNHDLDDSYIPNPNNEGFLMENPNAKKQCFYVKYDGIRISDYITKEEAIKLLKNYEGALFFRKVIEVEPKEEGYIDKSLPIVSAKIETGSYENRVIVRNTEGQEYEVFSYFPDEISFVEGEFIGLTGDEAIQLFHKKDVAYLRS